MTNIAPPTDVHGGLETKMNESEVRVLRLPEVVEKTGLCKALIYRLEDEGKFPSRVKLTKRATGWSLLEVNAWIIERIRVSRSSEKQP